MPARECSVPAALAAAGHDPFLYRLTRDGSGPAWHYRRDDGTAPVDDDRVNAAVAVLRRGPDDTPRSLAVLGPPREAAALLAELAPMLPQGLGITVPRGALPYAPRVLHAPYPADWDWRVTRCFPPRRPGEEWVKWLDNVPSTASAVNELLAEANPDSSTWPGEPKVRRWAGIRGADGSLDCCLADTSAGSQGHLSAISTRPGARGRGLGSAITAWATRCLLAEGWEIVTLGVYADNPAAQRTYDRLGFVLEHRFTSGTLAGPCAETEEAPAAESGCPDR